jgi:hypothetical protein
MTHPAKLFAILPLPLTITAPPCTLVPETFVIGAGFLMIEHDLSGRFSFELGCCSLAAGDSERILVDWLLPRMPTQGMLLGYKLADEAMPALIEASGSADPDTALAFIDALSRLASGAHQDVAAAVGGAGAPRLDEACRSHGIPAEPMDAERLISDWACGFKASMDQVLTTNVVALWRLWLHTSADIDEAGRARAEAALSCWLGCRPDNLAQAHRRPVSRR